MKATQLLIVVATVAIIITNCTAEAINPVAVLKQLLPVFELQTCVEVLKARQNAVVLLHPFEAAFELLDDIHRCIYAEKKRSG